MYSYINVADKSLHMRKLPGRIIVKTCYYREYAMAAFSLVGKKVLVTGAGKGMGRAIAIALDKSGSKVYALSRTKATLDTLVKDHPAIIPITQDLANWKETRETLDKIELLDGLVNNAGIADGYAPAVDYPPELLEKYVHNNLFSAINCTQAVTKKMIEAGKPGSVVNISSIIASLAIPFGLGYGLTKAGMDFVTKTFALELGPYNIRVNSVNPNLVMTEMTEKIIESGIPADKMYSGRSAIPRLPEIDEVVWPVLYLLSDASKMVTGTSHCVDGGVSANILTVPS